MEPSEFIKKVNFLLKNGLIDKEIWKDDLRFLRGKFALKAIENLSKLLNIFNFKDNILFENNVPLINLHGIKFKLDHPIFLKHSGKKYLSQSLKTIKFIRQFDLNPKIIIDIGACWGEYSLIFSKEFPNCKIFSIEGSPKNFNTLKHNIEANPIIGKTISPFNFIISDYNGVGKITNSLSTMNTVTNIQNNHFNQFAEVETRTLNNFLNDNKLMNVDFIKIDIEGSEISLLNDLKNNLFKIIQIELINYNKLEDNINFVESLSKIYNFYDAEDFKLLNMSNLKYIIAENLPKQVSLDLYLINKNYKDV